MDKKIMIAAVAVVAIVIVAAVAVVFMNNDGGNEETERVTNNLIVYGNANNDNKLDSKDVDFLKKIVNGDMTWDKATYPYADANVDGKITQADIDLVNKFIKGESAIMYYKDWNLGISSVHFPITGKISVSREVAFDIAMIGGWYDQIAGCQKTPDEIAKLDETAYPGSHKFISLRAESVAYEFDPVIASGVTLIAGDPYSFDDAVINQFANYNKTAAAGKTVDCLLLPHSREINGISWIQTIFALGVMTLNQDNTSDYVDYVDKIQSKLEDAVKNSANVKEKSYICLYAGSSVYKVSDTEFAADIYKAGAENYGDVTNLNMLPLTSAIKNPIDTYIPVTIDDILTAQPDVIFIEHTVTNATHQDAINNLKNAIKAFENTKAYKNNQIYYVAYDLVGSTAGVSSLLYLASQIWEGEFDAQDGIDNMKDYYNTFTKVDTSNFENTYFMPVGMKDL
ncbi:MAG: ABC transporter substrate-binding protein [archaeon]|nr:ABC transporter substrate-binding protein [archaeon]